MKASESVVITNYFTQFYTNFDSSKTQIKSKIYIIVIIVTVGICMSKSSHQFGYNPDRITREKLPYRGKLKANLMPLSLAC